MHQLEILQQVLDSYLLLFNQLQFQPPCLGGLLLCIPLIKEIG